MSIAALETTGSKGYGDRMALAEVLWERIQNSRPDESVDFMRHPENRGIEYSAQEKVAALASIQLLCS